MHDVSVVDQPRWPALDSIATPARMSFKMVWKSTGEPVNYDDPSKHFRFSASAPPANLRRKSTSQASASPGSPIPLPPPPPTSPSSAKNPTAATTIRSLVVSGCSDFSGTGTIYRDIVPFFLFAFVAAAFRGGRFSQCLASTRRLRYVAVVAAPHPIPTLPRSLCLSCLPPLR